MEIELTTKEETTPDLANDLVPGELYSLSSSLVRVLCLYSFQFVFNSMSFELARIEIMKEKALPLGKGNLLTCTQFHDF